MTTYSKEKVKYTVPEITSISLDNEISLVLQSPVTPPGGPGEDPVNPELEQNNPFQTTE